MTCDKCDDRRRRGPKHLVGQPCDICNDTGTDYIGRSCRHCSTPENVECPVEVDGKHPVEHDGAECWHCGAKPENVDGPT